MPLGSFTAFYLFDIADAIDLKQVRARIEASVSAPLATKPPTPIYLQYQEPPLVVEGRAVGFPDVDGCHIRFKAFDYGVLSVALTRPLPDTWPELLTSGLQWQEDSRLSAEAERLCREVMARIHHAVTHPRNTFLSEDYLVFTILNGGAADTADALLASQGPLIAQLLRGEREPLSEQERDEVLRHRISYYTSDMVIPTWSSAFVYDTQAGAAGVLEILEFANSQLLEFRYYDELLDAELKRIYAALQKTGWRETLLGRRYARAARQVHAFFIDVNELSDKTEHALNIAGDVYAARVFELTAARLALNAWKSNVGEKLKTVDDIYRFAVEHTSMSRGQFLELTIVLLIVLEIVLALL